MVTTDGHRLAFVEKKDVTKTEAGQPIDAFIPRRRWQNYKVNYRLRRRDQFGVDENHALLPVLPAWTKASDFLTNSTMTELTASLVHSLPHTFITDMMEASGNNLALVMSYSGDKSPSRSRFIYTLQ